MDFPFRHRDVYRGYNETPTRKEIAMEFALAVSFFFIVAIVCVAISIPLLIISRTARAVKKSVTKLHTPRRGAPKKA